MWNAGIRIHVGKTQMWNCAGTRPIVCDRLERAAQAVNAQRQSVAGVFVAHRPTRHQSPWDSIRSPRFCGSAPPSSGGRTVRYSFIKIGMSLSLCIKRPPSPKTTFIKNHIHQKPLSSNTTFIKIHFSSKTNFIRKKHHFHQKPLSSKTIFVKIQFQQKTLSSKSNFIKKP